jgi:membrane protein
MAATHAHHARSDTRADAEGRDAEAPHEVGGKGWLQILKRVKTEAKNDNLPLLAAGVAFFALLALAPALAATVSIYGIVADPADVQRQVGDALAAAPAEVRDLVSEQLETVTGQSAGGLGITAVISILLALWSASSGMKHLMEAINVAYGEHETRKFVKLRGTALLLTVGAIGFGVVAIGIITVVPLAFPLLAVGLVVGLAILYRYAPDRDEPRWSWTAPGTIIATVGWLVASVLFSIYTSVSGSYAETYGALGSVVVLMLWLMISAAMIILGAEVNAEAERQTVEDTTEGHERPLGHRDAYAADTVASSSES